MITGGGLGVATLVAKNKRASALHIHASIMDFGVAVHAEPPPCLVFCACRGIRRMRTHTVSVAVHTHPDSFTRRCLGVARVCLGPDGKPNASVVSATSSGY